ncbi:hypothetical protein BH09BAC3_BH09BAC3_10640 [soil metagenome]
MEDKKELFRGERFLPERDKKFPGKLTEDDKSGTFTLTIYGNQYFTGEYVKEKPDDLDRNNRLGNTRMKNLTTLMNCTFRSMSDIGEDLFEMTYQIMIVFDGAHFSSERDIFIKQVTIDYPYVSTSMMVRNRWKN